MTARFKVPTYRWLVEKALRDADDFLTAAVVAERANIDPGHARVALHNLKYCRAVECMREGDTLWWYSTPINDVRDPSKKREERAPETRPRAKRRKKITKQA